MTLQEALDLHQAGNLDAAEQAYRAHLQTAPDDVDALHLLGVLRQQEGRSTEAAELIGAALAQRPDDPVALTNRSAALNALRRCEPNRSCPPTIASLCTRAC